MQKTYDDCYLICSTAVYFEGQVRYFHPLLTKLCEPHSLTSI